jgi:hypothetical protein
MSTPSRTVRPLRGVRQREIDVVAVGVLVGVDEDEVERLLSDCMLSWASPRRISTRPAVAGE